MENKSTENNAFDALPQGQGELNKENNPTANNAIEKTYKVPPEVYDELKKRNIEFSDEELKYFELMYDDAMKFKNRKVEDDVLAHVAGGTGASTRLDDEFEEFCKNNPNLNRILEWTDTKKKVGLPLTLIEMIKSWF